MTDKAKVEDITKDENWKRHVRTSAPYKLGYEEGRASKGEWVPIADIPHMTRPSPLFKIRMFDWPIEGRLFFRYALRVEQGRETVYARDFLTWRRREKLYQAFVKVNHGRG